MQIQLCALLMLTTSSSYCAYSINDFDDGWSFMQTQESNYASTESFLQLLGIQPALEASPPSPIIVAPQQAPCSCEQNKPEDIYTKTYSMLHYAIRSLEGSVSVDQLNLLLSHYGKQRNAGNTLFHMLMSPEYDAKTFMCALSMTDPHRTGHLLNTQNASGKTVFKELITEGVFLPCNSTDEQIRHHVAQVYIKACLLLHLAPPASSVCIYHQNSDQLCTCNATVDELLDPAPFLPEYVQDILTYIKNEHCALKNRGISA